ncbi:hypothetical protein [Ornithinimicrobium kibberense]|uniref:hypothetical protein n=1 Tax=Ornithinimicrobium kibberense TaxID=282060 RepID=UPI00360D0A9B
MELHHVDPAVADGLGHQFLQLPCQVSLEVGRSARDFFDVLGGHAVTFHRMQNRSSVSRLPRRDCSIRSRYLSISSRSLMRSTRARSSSSSAFCAQRRASFLCRSCSIGSSVCRAALRLSFSFWRYSRINPSDSALRSSVFR